MMDNVGESVYSWNYIASYINNFDPGAALNTVKENLNPIYYRISRSVLGGEVSIKEDGEGVQWFGETFRCRINTQETKISGEHFWFVLAFSITTIAGSCLLYGWWSNRSAKNLLLKKVTELELEITKGKTEIGEIRKKIDEKEQEIKVLTQSVHEKELTITKLRADDICSLERDAEELEKKNKVLKEKQQKTSEKKNEYKTDASKKATLIRDIENEIRQLKETTIVLLEKELVALKETKDQLSEENMRLSDENKSLREAGIKTTSSVEMIAKNNLELQNKLEEAERKLIIEKQIADLNLAKIVKAKYMCVYQNDLVNGEKLEKNDGAFLDETYFYERKEVDEKASDGSVVMGETGALEIPSIKSPSVSPILSPRDNTNTEEGKEKEKGAEV